MPKLLHFEDDLTFASYFMNELTVRGFSVVHLAYPPVDVAALVLKEKPDILVSDIVMPGMDGFALAKFIKNQTATKHIPLVLLTSLGNERYRQEGLDAGADVYLTKAEFDADEFLNSLLTLLAR
ncbi:hypothetical protein COV04_04430 [Candidatus Uhrbacteria bacterium CG10_big_fil_rev_8_21_14_0_10_48_11]|uniref:Response regulatory domain-containing protein n=1 Tax=Candidatus Uhrbacteria bacterium CG10_big_fil_rev_8_21_14_0_10_48_11 TaxID=1975037 RepID=A0A2M8LDK7_9BACT|nr:MAG: hypothetical protein COV04_04430 [Candidatus Uhrbacteria bacterium CG10_big_fil_rev_8_21_14_0_10_48_11]